MKEKKFGKAKPIHSEKILKASRVPIRGSISYGSFNRRMDSGNLKVLKTFDAKGIFDPTKEKKKR